MIKFRELSTITKKEINFILTNIFGFSEAETIENGERKVIFFAKRKEKEFKFYLVSLKGKTHISCRNAQIGYLELFDKKEIDLLDKYLFSLGMNSILKDNPYLVMGEKPSMTLEELAAEHVGIFKKGTYPLEVYLGGLTLEVGTEMLNQLGMTWRVKMSEGTCIAMRDKSKSINPMIELELFDGFITKATGLKTNHGGIMSNDSL